MKFSNALSITLKFNIEKQYESKFSVCLWPLSLTTRTSKFVSKGFTGTTYGPFVFVTPESTKNLLLHEMVHVKQFWRTLGLHGMLYRFSDRYKLKSEVEAYRVQYQAGSDPKGLARLLSEKYDLEISYQEALRKITED